MACTVTFVANTDFCTNVGGLTAVKIGSVSAVVRPERSYFNYKYTYNKDTGVGLWEGDLYLYFGAASSANQSSLASVCTAGSSTIVATTNSITEGSTSAPYYWTITGAYVSEANITSGTKLEDGTAIDATFHFRSATIPACSNVAPTE